MGIKCSLLGHRFGETTVEREREEEGTEVVITITEMETCSRCGETRVVSENKEVTTLETPDDADDEGDAVDAEDRDAADASGDGPDAETPDVDASEKTDAVILDDTDSESSAQAEARGSETTIPDAESGTSAESDSEDDDAVIIGDAESGAGDEGDSSMGDEAASGTADASETDAAESSDGEGDADDDREPGEWPDEPDAVDPAERAGETAEVEILGDDGDEDGGDTDAAAVDDRPAGPDMDPDPSELAGESAPDEAAEPGSSDDRSESAGSAHGAGAGEWPDEDERTGAGSDAMGDWPEATKRDEPPESDVSGPSLDGEESQSVDVPEGMFKCSECGFTTEADSSSLRAGDFCPECHRGTLLQNEEDRAAEE